MKKKSVRKNHCSTRSLVVQDKVSCKNNRKRKRFQDDCSTESLLLDYCSARRRYLDNLKDCEIYIIDIKKEDVLVFNKIGGSNYSLVTN